MMKANYRRLNARYISGTTGAAAQFKNQHLDSAAIVVLSPKGQPAKVMLLQPGESSTVTLEKMPILK